jgi:hypothetical protein
VFSILKLRLPSPSFFRVDGGQPFLCMVYLNPSSDNIEGGSCRILLCVGDIGHKVGTEGRVVANSFFCRQLNQPCDKHGCRGVGLHNRWQKLRAFLQLYGEEIDSYRFRAAFLQHTCSGSLSSDVSSDCDLTWYVAACKTTLQ